MSLARIKKGDLVQVIAGKEKGKTGKVLSFKNSDRVILEKINLVKKHSKPTQANPQGGIIEKEAALHISNVLPLCPKTNKPTRLQVREVKGKKERICQVSKEVYEVKS